MVAAVDPYLIDWLDLSFRFLHVIAAMVWIGTKRLRNSCGSPATGARPRNPVPVGAINGAVFCMPSVRRTTSRSFLGSAFH